ncbi:SGNH hydrolase [Pleurotus eryngii]|uniref:SGNH hydrolase n=1 Tax=Pleurotus eryngii TaxID=5323 RepID=A0A9P6A5J8_PLEER|nr:SGNH hydrolase [Pleurotus eryngii]
MASPIHDVIMLFGDSITQGGWQNGGFGHRLDDAYSRKFDVLNRGLAGYNTDWALHVFRQASQYLATVDEQKHAPRLRLLTIWFGANDACIKPSPQHVPLDKFTENIKTIVRMITLPSSAYYSPDTKIILITPPPVNTIQRSADLASRNPPLALDRKFDVTKLYADAVKSVAGEEKVALLDVWAMFWEASGSQEALSKYLSDGLHPSALGYDLVYDGLVATIAREYPELHYEKIKPLFPL